MRIILFILLCLIFIGSCKKDKIEKYTSLSDYLYFNFDTACYNIYNVYELQYDDFNSRIDTFNYQIKEVNQSFFFDFNNKKCLRLERFKRNDDKQKWQPLSVYYSTLNNQDAQRVEENARFTSMVFPINEDAFWNRNNLNPFASEFMYYENISNSFMVDTAMFNNTVTITLQPTNTELYLREMKEVYAQNIGLVYKNDVKIELASSKKRGYKRIIKLLEHVKK